MSDTPRTDAEVVRIKGVLDAACKSGTWDAPVLAVPVEFSKAMELKLNDAIKQRDTLADALQNMVTALWNSPKANAETITGYAFIMVQSAMALKTLEKK